MRKKFNVLILSVVFLLSFLIVSSLYQKGLIAKEKSFVNISSFTKEQLEKTVFKVDENNIIFDPWLNGFPYRRAITISNSGGALTDYQVLVTNPIYNENGLVSSWHFNEGSGTIAYDSSGNNNNGNLVNGPTWVDGKFGKALQFDGIDDYVYTTNQFSNPQTFSIVVWFKTTTSGRKIIGFENAQTGTGSQYWDRQLYIGTDGKLYFGVYDGSTKTISTPNTVNDGNWHFAVATFSNNVMRLYLDGNFIGSLSTGSAQNYNGWWRIGSYKCSGWPNCGDGYFSGIIDEVRIYNRALSDAEIQALYQAKARLDYGDIRFTDSDGVSLLNYWQEADGKFWVKVPNIPANSNKIIYLYYGSPSATSMSNGMNTFVFFDDFNDNDISDWSTNGWGSYNGDIIADNGKMRLRVYKCYNVEAYKDLGNINGQINIFFEWRTLTDYWYEIPGWKLFQGSTTLIDSELPICYACDQSGTNTTIISVNGQIRLLYRIYQSWACSYGDHSNTYLWIDNIRIRKYTSPEPTISLGSEDVLITQAGSPTNWQWKVPNQGEKIRSGSATNWQWITFQNDGTGIAVPRGSATNWQWGP